MTKRKTNITEILGRWRDGDAQALDELAPLVMQDLRQLAVHSLRGPEAHGIQVTELVNEFYAVVADDAKKPSRTWHSRKQFFAFAGKSMRHLMLSALRKQKTIKRGGDLHRVPLDDVLNQNHDPDQVLRIGDALEDLERLDPLQARIVDLRFFVGLTQDETADALEIGKVQLRTQWEIARMWLRQALAHD
ncbi:MAG: ECF-type sigma factor [Gammaproteobacteria bacterium]